jgi:hypothetical protein
MWRPFCFICNFSKYREPKRRRNVRIALEASPPSVVSDGRRDLLRLLELLVTTKPQEHQVLCKTCGIMCSFIHMYTWKGVIFVIWVKVVVGLRIFVEAIGNQFQN